MTKLILENGDFGPGTVPLTTESTCRHSQDRNCVIWPKSHLSTDSHAVRSSLIRNFLLTYLWKHIEFPVLVLKLFSSTLYFILPSNQPTTKVGSGKGFVIQRIKKYSCLELVFAFRFSSLTKSPILGRVDPNLPMSVFSHWDENLGFPVEKTQIYSSMQYCYMSIGRYSGMLGMHEWKRARDSGRDSRQPIDAYRCL